ncbi:MAG TPA: carboxypeptidase-like regulatory domain-containing protein, partial [Thermoanaerobaculia bacterium]|nr:carboxypeptidase-like regulatory domain-containing protein [Thermoanaerobaculia bacterium]
CDVHPWMVAYVGILDHPFYAVTRSDGSFRIAGLPAGTYTLEAWHEALGIIDQEIRVDPGKPVMVHLDFQPKP